VMAKHAARPEHAIPSAGTAPGPAAAPGGRRA
jgi:hypothetical protein